jgi:hypothetical protein
MNEYHLATWEVLKGGSMLVTGSCRIEKQDARITKPSLIGSFILGVTAEEL